MKGLILTAFALTIAGGVSADSGLVRFAEAFEHHLVPMEAEAYADVFNHHESSSNWQTEFWGKYMHSAVPLLKRFPNAELERHVRASAKIVMDAQLPDGYIGNYKEDLRAREHWDIWGIKYTLMGLLYYYDLTGEARPLACARKLADWLMREVGPGGKRRIVSTGNYQGLASCSVLEPIVWLSRVTKETRYLDFAAEIAREIGYEGDGAQIVKKGLAGIPVVARGRAFCGRDCQRKAYEMMSCHQGLLEYAELCRERGRDNRREQDEIVTATRKVADDIRTNEVNLVGGAAAEEFWYNGAASQTHPFRSESETCVTITWMRLCAKLYRMTGEAVYLAEVRKTFFNVYLAALSPDATRFASYPVLWGRTGFVHGQCGFKTNCCNQNGMRGFVTALDLGIIAGRTPADVKAVVPPQGAWKAVRQDGHLAVVCGELVMAFVDDDAALPLDPLEFKLEEVKSRLVPYAAVGGRLHRVWRECVREPNDVNAVQPIQIP